MLIDSVRVQRETQWDGALGKYKGLDTHSDSKKNLRLTRFSYLYRVIYRKEKKLWGA